MTENLSIILRPLYPQSKNDRTLASAISRICWVNLGSANAESWESHLRAERLQGCISSPWQKVHMALPYQHDLPRLNSDKHQILIRFRFYYRKYECESKVFYGPGSLTTRTRGTFASSCSVANVIRFRRNFFCLDRGANIGGSRIDMQLRPTAT